MANSYYQSAFGSSMPALTIGDTVGRPVDEERATLINSTGSAVAYGLAVVEDSTAPTTKAKLPSATTDKLVGVAISAYASTNPASSDARNYANGDAMVVETCGIVPMEAGEAITADDAVYIETSGADAGKPFASDGSTAGSYTLTLDKALAGGVRRVQKLVLSADLVADDTVNGAIAGTAIAATAYATSHVDTMTAIIAAIRAAAETAGVVIEEIYIAGATFREIHIVSSDVGASTLALTAWAVTSGGAGTAVFASATGADITAGIAAASVSVSVNGTTVATGWAGSSEATMLAFGQELDALAAVSSATLSSSSLVLTLASASPLTLASPTVTGGEATPATLAAATVSAGVAATRIAWTKARFLSAASDGGAVAVRFDARIP